MVLKAIYQLLQIGLFIAIAPLVSGLINKIKNNLRMRRGPSVWQPYFNLIKYFLKSETISEHTSWIFRFTPYIVFGATVTAAFCLRGDLVTIVFLLALGRFFLALAGLDAASAFGGMGSSREMFISSLVEPVVLLAIFGVSLAAGTTNLTVISSSHPLTISILLAGIALFLVTLAETSRIPIDNQETHLELTMIHEAMVLEYSGRSLALLEWAAYLKQLILFTIMVNLIYIGWGPNVVEFLVKILLLAGVISLVELAVAKMRLFRVVDFLAFAGIIAILSIIGVVLGV